MQIIQTIRDKGAAIMVGVIAVCLIGFLLMDAKPGSGGSIFSSNSNNIGKVNGAGIDRTDFNAKYDAAYAQAQQQSQQSGQAPNAEQVREQVWNQMVSENIFYAEAEKLGIDFTGKELSATLYSNDQNNPLMREQGFADPNTGRIDPAKVAQIISTIKKAKGEQYAQFSSQLVEPTRLGSMAGKYSSLLSASAYYPNWMKERDNAEAKNFANISYTFIPYNEISDSTVKVSDAEITSFVSKHPKMFKQEAGRFISYVTFAQVPSASDSAETLAQVTAQKNPFSTATNVASFVASNGFPSMPYDSTYKAKSAIRSTAIDSIVRLPVGAVYGPYIDNGGYTLAKYVGSKVTQDSAKARHILISLNNEQGQPIYTDSSAKVKADSILALINKGADFGALAKQYSSDPGSKDKGGLYDYFPYGQKVPEFNDFAFNKPAGTRGVVKTNFGYHIMEAMGTKGSSPKYKIAFIGKEILASEATFNKASLAATQLAAQKNSKDFDAYTAKNGLTKVSWPTIVKENDFSVGQLQDARGLVKWAFDAKKGDVSEVLNINNQFVVAMLDGAADEGTQSAATARPMAETAVRNKKKAEIIIKKIGATPTLESAATAYNKQVQSAGADSSITFINPMIANVGMEPKVIGAAFNKTYQTKASPAIEGNTGVFVIKVNGVSTKPTDTPEQATQNAASRANAAKQQAAAGWFEGLKNQATIKDNRSKFF
jgi:peptidyl-prolyl cis-trans isomerase D